MKNLRLFRDYRDIRNRYPKTSLAIGNFDGVHLGHQGLIKEARNIAESSKSKLVVFTFYPHPLKLLRPGSEPKNILSFKAKLLKMERLGVEVILAQRFTKSFSHITAEQFVSKILLKYLCAVNIIVGEDFSFGYKREGNISYLRSGILNNKAELKIIDPIKSAEGRYSSTFIRNLISKGNVKKVKQHLGNHYEIEGVVFKGKQLGSKLGFPTANINYIGYITPKDGIYAGLVFYKSHYYQAALSSGTRPHFNGNKRFLEAHIFKFNENIYGKKLRVIFIDRIRDEAAFKNNDELKLQIQKDCENAKYILSKIRMEISRDL